MLIQLGTVGFAAAASAFAVGFVAGPVRAWLVGAGIHDAPTARSSHAADTPRGGGLAVLAIVLPGWLLGGWLTAGPAPLALAGLTAAVAGVSFIDDVRGLSPAVRLPAQLLAVLAGLLALDPAPLFPELLPIGLERGLLAVAWLWFVNLYNFMDGIDGITAVETCALGLGIGLVALATGAGADATVAPWLLAGSAVGFLWWNWAPARLFLGDVGSVPLGFALGWLLLDLAAGGHLAAALILPGYYLLDATVTLLQRVARGETVWQAHKQHAYQRAVQRGLSHSVVAGRIAAANLPLVGCALWAANGQPWFAAAAASLVCLGLWANLRYGGRVFARA